ncbi:MAG: 3-methyl-2-oxobutanoate hydroxymethyltransferase [Firmicutes bacterium]|jgi:3-methyl-2-oxobutanoate hydroxymethyltransferase|nr:3-methyl-2-oxobutanoate hydroxymethyltransferase [Bacillota bacterium]
MPEGKITIIDLKEKKKAKEKITMLTAYDYPTSELVDEAGVDTILVGDSLGMVVLGYKDTLAVTLDEMIHHARAVVRGAKRAMVIIDMPFMTYQIGREQAMSNAARAIQESGADAVKLEGGEEIIEAVKGITGAGIPVIGHLGLTPQSVGQMGGFKVQGKDMQTALKMVNDARMLEEAGAFGIVLECVPWLLARLITEQLSIPTIGIGAGEHCDGQVLVYHDVMGLYTGKRPKFVKQYARAREEMEKGVKSYIEEVKNGTFPADEHRFGMSEEVFEKLARTLDRLK